MLMSEQLLLYVSLFMLIALLYLRSYRRHHDRSVGHLRKSIEDGLTEPASLHPVIDPSICLSSMSCVSACPEGRILGIVHGKAQLVKPTNCIGHGACAASCPHGAITLVFGTARRGVDIPEVDSGFESTVKGIFIAGELGGMGLIRNAIIQGRQAVDSIVERGYVNKGCDYDLVIIGAGPAGLSAALRARQQGLNYVVLEQESVGGTIAHYPRGKLVMTSPVELPLYGKLNFRSATKEELMEVWKEVNEKFQLNILTDSRADRIERLDDGFLVRTSTGEYRSSAVLLSLGRRGTPRKLGVPGEDQPKVVYRLVDAAQYRGQRVLVVGGGDSALEAALALSEQEDTVVTLSYRGEAFNRAKAANRHKIDTAVDNGGLTVLFKSNVTHIGERDVRLAMEDGEITIENDIVIVNAGGVLPTGFLKSIGINVVTKYGTA